jgi:hypothetical protein
MKVKHMALTLAALALVQVSSWCQTKSPASPTGSAREKSDFAPLAEWKEAVGGGNKADIAKFYSTTPPAHVETSAGASNDSADEINFWADLSAKGLSDFTGHEELIFDSVRTPSGSLPAGQTSFFPVRGTLPVIR